MYNQEILKQVVNETVDVPQILVEDIPKIDLYMDQLVNFLDDNLAQLQRDDDTPFVTKTMINNYTKLKLMSPAEKKKYKEHHILQIAMIVQLKHLLSMQDIGKIATHLTEDSADIYNLFLEAQKKAFSDLPKRVDEAVELLEKYPSLADSKDGGVAAVAMELVASAHSQLLLAEKLLDRIETQE